MTTVDFAVRNVDGVVKIFIRNYARERNITMGKALDEIIQCAQVQLEKNTKYI